MRNCDNAKLTPRLGCLVQEWFNKSTGQVHLRPTAKDLGKGNLEKRTGSFARGDIEVVLASFAMYSDGKIRDVQVVKVENGYVTVQSPKNGRCLRNLAKQSSEAQWMRDGDFSSQI